MSCSIARAKHRNGIATRWRLRQPVWGTKADKIVAQRKDLQDLLEIIRTAL